VKKSLEKKKTISKDEALDNEGNPISEVNDDKISEKKDIFEYKLTEDEKLISRKNRKNKSSSSIMKKTNSSGNTNPNEDEGKNSSVLNCSYLSIDDLSTDLNITKEVNHYKIIVYFF